MGKDQHLIKDLALCPNKLRCGSCEWSEYPYESQLLKKLDYVNNRFSNLKLDVECKDIVPSDMTSYYRNRMDFVIDYMGNFGLREKGKWWKVIDNHTCFLPDKKIIDIFNKVYPWVKNSGVSYFDRKKFNGLSRYAIIRTTTLGETMLVILTSVPQTDLEYKKVKDSLNLLAEDLKLTSVVWQSNSTNSDVSFGDRIESVWGKPHILEKINSTNYIISPSSFFQTNSYTAGKLQSKVLDFARKSKAKRILDLYCGSGFFTIPLAQFAKSVKGVEQVESAIYDAKVNVNINKLGNVDLEFIATKSEDFSIENFLPELVLVDPPRSGMHKNVIKQLLEIKPSNLIYVSCNPHKFAEELVIFQSSYKAIDIIAVDMFPHTHHVELVSRLELK